MSENESDNGGSARQDADTGKARVSGALANAVPVVSFLLTAFGGILIASAPPEAVISGFNVGGASFAALIILLLVSALADGRALRRNRKWWMIAAGGIGVFAVAMTVIYPDLYDRYTFPWPEESSTDRYVRGATMLPAAEQFMRDNSITSVTAMVRQAGGIDERFGVWSEDSVRNGRRILTIAYLALVLSYAASIFCLTRGVLDRKGTR